MAHVAKYKAPALGHMFAHWDRVGSVLERENIDATATHLNYTIGQQRHVMDVMGLRDSVSRQPRVRKVRSDAVLVCDWVFTAPVDLRPEDERRFFEVCHTYCVELYGEHNMLGGRVHVDEPRARHHMHEPFTPTVCDSEGVTHFDAKGVLSRAHLRAFHKGLQERVDRELGYHVSVTLDESQKGKKQLNHLQHTEYIAATRALEDSKRRAAHAVTHSKEVSAEAQQAEQKAASLKESVSRLETTVTHLEGRRDELDAEVTVRCNAVADFGAQERALRESVSHLQGDVTHLEGRRATLQGTVDALGAEVEARQAELDTLKESVSRLATQRDGLSDGVAAERQRLLDTRARRMAVEAEVELARNSMPDGVSREGLESVFAFVARQVADLVVGLWDDAHDWARRRWRRWDGDEKQQVAGLLNIEGDRAQTLSDGALVDSAASIDRQDIAEEIILGGEDHSQTWGRRL